MASESAVAQGLTVAVGGVDFWAQPGIIVAETNTIRPERLANIRVMQFILRLSIRALLTRRTSVFYRPSPLITEGILTLKPLYPQKLARIFWAGLVARWMTAPFLLQWFHPDERQMFEFAHFQAQGRLQPFMEAMEHLRNQTLPFLFSILHHGGRAWVILTVTHLLIGTVSWLTMFAWVRSLWNRYPESRRQTIVFGWTLALFWIFPLLGSRQLLETTALPFSILLWLALESDRPVIAGLAAGATAMIRYPNALFGVGALFRVRSLPRYIAGGLLAVSVFAVMDFRTYGDGWESIFAYFHFNRPYGPVQAMFGSDSIEVYYRFFEFAFTPWLAPVFLVVASACLVRSRRMLVFLTPYLIGHWFTPHREPRFMIPLLPFLFYAIWEECALRPRPQFAALRGGLSRTALLWQGLLWIHVVINFAWYPWTVWCEWNSAQSLLIRHETLLQSQPARLINEVDPMIDALVPYNAQWSGPDCHWRRPVPATLTRQSPLWVISARNPGDCEALTPRVAGDGGDTGMAGWALRLSRTRWATIWSCPETAIARICPRGMQPPLSDEPTFTTTLRRDSLAGE